MSEHKDKENGTNRLDIKPTQVTAGALAAVTAAVLGSKLGVAGTVAGAGLASVVGTVGTAMYERSIHAAKDRVTSRIKQEEPPAGASHDAETVRLMVEPPKQETGKRRWPKMVAATVVAFVLGMGVLTVVELVGGQASSGNGQRTTVGALFGQPGQTSAPHPTSTAPTSTSTTTTSSTAPTTTSSTPPPSSSTSSEPTTTPSSATTVTTTTQQQSTSTSGGPPPGAS
ncbi:hypothetical protein [Kutzneria sp. CA-103260]|uniref:hypothetical protein n=1 Tax=Kutzneria sp. CA-103260 TaxID=2802641 RepID=UPI001BA5FEA8|nr:hypothetical protein [Kutzneria sp. CA-103260]QUQ69554.1 hypothetical protein JJ691_73120 [Kutzneria sp. CA-103260]